MQLFFKVSLSVSVKSSVTKFLLTLWLLLFLVLLTKIISLMILIGYAFDTGIFGDTFLGFNR